MKVVNDLRLHRHEQVDHMNGFHARRLSNTKDLPSEITLGTVGFHVYDNIVRSLLNTIIGIN